MQKNLLLVQELCRAVADVNVSEKTWALDSFRICWEEIIKTIKNSDLKSGEKEKKLETADSIFRVAEEMPIVPDMQAIKCCIEYIIDMWELIWNCPHTYLALDICARTVIAPHTEENRERFLTALTEASKKW